MKELNRIDPLSGKVLHPQGQHGRRISYAHELTIGYEVLFSVPAMTVKKVERFNALDDANKFINKLISAGWDTELRPIKGVALNRSESAPRPKKSNVFGVSRWDGTEWFVLKSDMEEDIALDLLYVMRDMEDGMTYYLTRHGNVLWKE